MTFNQDQPRDERGRWTVAQAVGKGMTGRYTIAMPHVEGELTETTVNRFERSGHRIYPQTIRVIHARDAKHAQRIFRGKDT